jgi:hypothetical protein
MPTIYNREEWLTPEELRSLLKAEIRKNAAEIPALIKQKELEYV